MEMNRRAALAGIFAIPALVAAKTASAAPYSSFVPLRPGEALVGLRVHNGRIIDAGRRMTVAQYNGEFGANVRADGSVMANCNFTGPCNGGVARFFDQSALRGGQ